MLDHGGIICRRGGFIRAVLAVIRIFSSLVSLAGGPKMKICTRGRRGPLTPLFRMSLFLLWHLIFWAFISICCFLNYCWITCLVAK
jgi:hypothetical protein